MISTELRPWEQAHLVVLCSFNTNRPRSTMPWKFLTNKR